MKKIKILIGDDWQGLFVDGKLFYENHSIKPDKILDACGVDYSIQEISNNYALDDLGGFCSTLDECKTKGIIL